MIDHNVDNQSINSNESSHKPGKRPIKLPDIKLPTFSGAYEQWIEYRDTFKSLIHENIDITDIQKFHYLRASLEGTASQVIKSFEFSANNYNAAWEILCKRYDNKNALIYNHLDGLFGIEKITKASSFKIRKLIDTISKHLRALEVLEQQIKFWDVLVIHLITKSLDTVTFSKWEEYKGFKENLILETCMTF